MELKKTDLKGYREILIDSLNESERLYSISFTTPRKVDSQKKIIKDLHIEKQYSINYMMMKIMNLK